MRKYLVYCYNCKSTFSYDEKTLYESETMSSCPMTDEEFFNRDIESALRRYERKVNLNKVFN